MASASTCNALAWTCTGSDECQNGQICCIAVTNAAGAGSVSCQAAPSCPSAQLASAQLCKTDAECPSGSHCVVLNCANSFFPRLCDGTQQGIGVNQCSIVGADAGADANADTGPIDGSPADAASVDAPMADSSLGD
jgi:hypothetical protein